MKHTSKSGAQGFSYKPDKKLVHWLWISDERDE